jgi:hypothetical protein
MSGTGKFLSIVVCVVSLLVLSCGRASGQEYDLDKASPDGAHRVRIEVRAKPPKGTRDHTDYAKVQFFKGEQAVHEYEWEQSDQFEPSFHDSYPVVEWVDNNVLRMGKEQSKQPFYDELVVSNNTDERIKYLGVDYGRYESFEVFDLAPGSHVTLRASPGLNGTTFNYSLGYSGVTESGKEFTDTLEGKQRKSTDEGPLKFQITISSKDLK